MQSKLTKPCWNKKINSSSSFAVSAHLQKNRTVHIFYPLEPQPSESPIEWKQNVKWLFKKQEEVFSMTSQGTCFRLLLHLQFLVFILLKLCPHRKHLLLKFRSTQLKDVQHKRKLDILHAAKLKITINLFEIFWWQHLISQTLLSKRPTLRTLAFTDSFSL